MADVFQPATTELIEALHGVLRQVAEPTHVLKIILEQAVSRTGAERGLFVEVAEAGQLEYRVLHGFSPQQLEGDAGQFSRSLFTRVSETGEDVLLASATDDPYFAGIQSVRALRVASMLCMPIHAAGRVAAIVHLEHRREGHFTAAHREQLRSLLDLAGPVLETLKAGRTVIGERDRLHASETRLRSEAEESRKLLRSDWSFGRFVGRSQVVRDLEVTVRRVAATNFPVLLLGESGTGKSVIARVIHYGSARAAHPLITVFCPSLERGMVEAELFGHKKGSFTGAQADRIGKVQAADQGTLFLDEIGELPLEIQPKLLRLLQEKTFEQMGDPKERHADLRVIAATNRDLEYEVEQGRFRRDLYERLNYVPVRIPPLRERVDDIALLLRHALDQSESGRWIEVSAAAEQCLRDLDYAWPGNVRHLEQLAARLSLGGVTSPVTPEAILELLNWRPPAGATTATANDLSQGLPSLLEDAERSWLGEALRIYPGLTRAELAARLKISESALYKKLRHYGLGA